MNQDLQNQQAESTAPATTPSTPQDATSNTTPSTQTPPNPHQNNNPNEIKPKKSGLPLKTFLLILVLAAITATLIYIALQNAAKVEQTSPGTVTPNVSPKLENPIQTTITISSAAVKLSTPSAYSTNIIINTGQNTVNKVQLEIAYDPDILTNVNIETGKFFTNPQILLKNIDSKNGRITFAIGVQNEEVGILGQGVVAKLNFTAFQKPASTSVTLLPKTQVSADGYSQSVLKTTVNGLFNLNESPFKATTSGN